LYWVLGDHVEAKSTLHIAGAVLAAVHHVGLAKQRIGLDVFGTIQPFGDCILGFFFTGLSPAPLKSRRD